MRTIESIAKPRKTPKRDPNMPPVYSGRPKEVGQNGMRQCVYLEEQDMKRARMLGMGNVSKGIRIALRNVKAPKNIDFEPAPIKVKTLKKD